VGDRGSDTQLAHVTAFVWGGPSRIRIRARDLPAILWALVTEWARP
jgi:hypothetical protein